MKNLKKIYKEYKKIRLMDNCDWKGINLPSEIDECKSFEK